MQSPGKISSANPPPPVRQKLFFLILSKFRFATLKQLLSPLDKHFFAEILIIYRPPAPHYKYGLGKD